MSPRFSLLKLLPLITFITVLFPTANIARAASSPSVKDVAATQELLTKESDKVMYLAAGAKDAGAYDKSSSTAKIVLSEKAIKIKFFVFCGLMVLGIFVPELFFNPKKSNQPLGSEGHQEDKKKQPQAKAVKPDMEFLQIISEQAQQSNGKVENKKSRKSA